METKPRRILWDVLIIGGCATLNVVLLVMVVAFNYSVGFTLSSWKMAVAVLLLCVQAAVLYWRQTKPLPSFVATFVFFVLLYAVTGERTLSGMPAVLIASVFLAAFSSIRTTLIALSAATVAEIAIQTPTILHNYEPALLLVAYVSILTNAVISYGMCGLFGTWASLQFKKIALAKEHARLLESTTEARIHEAVMRERLTMARDLHDVAAHHLSGIAIQSKAALMVHPTDPHIVEELLRDIRSQSQETLTNLRHIVGILRDNDDLATTPHPLLTDVPTLVESTRKRNPQVCLTIAGDVAHLPLAVSFAGYRVVQESLSNANAHAPGAAVTITISVQQASVSIEVVNSRPTRAPVSTPGGFGLTGMRERVEILGGTFAAGPTRDGGWRTQADIPLEVETTSAMEKVA